MVAAIGAAAALGGAAISASGARSAAGQQAAAADRATQAQLSAQQQQRSDLAPWVQAGVGANSALQRYLGLGGAGSGGTTSLGLPTGLSRDQVRDQLLSQYTRNVTGAPTSPATQDQGNSSQQMTQAYFGNAPVGTPAQQTSTVDEAGLNSAIDKYYAEQGVQNAAAAQDPNYGSLLRAYRNGEDFSFTGKDLASDPGYQFGLNQGTQGLDRAQASRGNFLSGAAVKEAARFNEDYAGTKFGDAFNRNLNTWNTNLGAYNDNRNRVFNFLNGVSTLGQNSAAGTGAAALNVGNNIANNALATGNANAASSVATGNALQSGINQAANAYNSYNNRQASGTGLSGYDFGYNGQSNPSNQQGLNSLVNRYSGYTG